MDTASLSLGNLAVISQLLMNPELVGMAVEKTKASLEQWSAAWTAKEAVLIGVRGGKARVAPQHQPSLRWAQLRSWASCTWPPFHSCVRLLLKR